MTKRRAVLCVDDEERDLQLQRATFEDAGYHVLVARNLPEVNAVLEEHTPDAVILDYRLMNVDAVHVAITIRKQHPRMPIVILSGYLDDIPEYFKRAVDGCLTKDHHPDDWVTMLRDQFGGTLGATI
jgi:CheY-like chemotaxis protein